MHCLARPVAEFSLQHDVHPFCISGENAMQKSVDAVTYHDANCGRRHPLMLMK